MTDEQIIRAVIGLTMLVAGFGLGVTYCFFRFERRLKKHLPEKEHLVVAPVPSPKRTFCPRCGNTVDLKDCDKCGWKQPDDVQG